MIKSVKQLPELKKRKLTSKQLKKHNFIVGQNGEDQALNYLLRNNYRIIAKNIRVERLEIDIICLDTKNDEIVFVEVKKRLSSKYGLPSKAVNESKINKLNLAAQKIVLKYNFNKDYRFDIISIEVNKIRHFKNITWP